jgi:hypothetical protein
MIKRLESYLRTRRVERLATVKLDDGCDLAWSQAKNRGHWRFVVRDEDSVTELLYSSREERADVFTSGSMRRLLDRLEVLQ